MEPAIGQPALAGTQHRRTLAVLAPGAQHDRPDRRARPGIATLARRAKVEIAAKSSL